MSMSKTLLLIITGPSCTGKTTLAQKIGERFELPVISRDDIKESLFDSLGVKDREWSKSIGAASFGILYKMIHILLKARKSFIIETPLNPEYDGRKFLELKQEYDFEVIQVMCKAEGNILFERFKKRSESGDRHPGHVDERNYDEFKEVLLKGYQEPLDIGGKVFEIDTTDYSTLNHESVFDLIETATNDT
ncbi:AAA family ATPase [Candidatus Peregrinibacteria bacterium]|nr:AAA family ATPase [Candidatus Peregrinibacteria bacterium]